MAKIGQRRKKLPLRFPFQKAVDSYRENCLSRKDFDPAVTFAWGQLMGMGVLRLLDAVESRYGKEGQTLCRDTLRELGREVFHQMADGVEVPEGVDSVELVSLWLSWVNEVIWASIEEPYITNKDECGCRILYCPHQDVYKPFDCRVQRYFVEGVGLAAAELWGEKFGRFDTFFRHSIPQGNPDCLFEVKRSRDGESWSRATDEIDQKALKRVEKKRS